jgi:hypothetical protein
LFEASAYLRASPRRPPAAESAVRKRSGERAISSVISPTRPGQGAIALLGQELRRRGRQNAGPHRRREYLGQSRDNGVSRGEATTLRNLTSCAIEAAQAQTIRHRGAGIQRQGVSVLGRCNLQGWCEPAAGESGTLQAVLQRWIGPHDAPQECAPLEIDERRIQLRVVRVAQSVRDSRRSGSNSGFAFAEPANALPGTDDNTQ